MKENLEAFIEKLVHDYRMNLKERLPDKGNTMLMLFDAEDIFRDMMVNKRMSCADAQRVNEAIDFAGEVI